MIHVILKLEIFLYYILFDMILSGIIGLYFFYYDNQDYSLTLYPKCIIRMLMNNLSATVKRSRKQYDLTQEELALKFGAGCTLFVTWNGERNRCVLIRWSSFLIPLIMKWLPLQK